MFSRFFSNPEKNLISLFLAALVPLMLAEAARRHFLPVMESWPLRGAAGLSIIIPACFPFTIFAATTGMVTNHIFVAGLAVGFFVHKSIGAGVI